MAPTAPTRREQNAPAFAVRRTIAMEDQMTNCENIQALESPSALRALKPAVVLLALGVLLGLHGPAIAQQKPPIRIGAILPMTGFAASAGLTFKTGIAIAVDEINAKGGVNGSRLELVVEDDKLLPQESVMVYRKQAGQGVVAVLGPIASSSWENVAPIAPRVRLPAISFTFTYKEGVPNNEWTIAISPDERTMLPEAVAEFVKLHPNVKTVVVAADIRQASGVAAIQLFRDSAKKHGIKIAEVVEFEIQTTDFAPIVTRIRGHNPDAVWTAGITHSIVAMLREMQSQKFDPIVLNSALLWPGAFPQIAGAAGAKVYSMGFSTNEKLAGNARHDQYIHEFQARLRGQTQIPQPANPGNSVMGYEGVYVLASILRQKGVDGTWETEKARIAIKDGLRDTKEFTNVFHIKINQERNGYVPAHLLKVDVGAKQWIYALPRARH
jgi:ABC-type branched-subunit amino acid transport system substrate-binding protein